MSNVAAGFSASGWAEEHVDWFAAWFKLSTAAPGDANARLILRPPCLGLAKGMALPVGLF